MTWQTVDKRQLDLLQREHVAWLARGRTGTGRVDLTRPDFQSADLHGLRFGGARFTEPRLAGASLAGTDLADTEITRGDLQRVVLSYAGAKGAHWSDIDATSASGDLATFAGAELTRCDFTAASLRRVSWAGAKLTTCTFDRADLTDATWDGARLTKCSLRNAILTRVDGREHDPRGSAQKAVFLECDLRGANFTGVRLAGTKFERCRIGDIAGLGDEVELVRCEP